MMVVIIIHILTISWNHPDLGGLPLYISSVKLQENVELCIQALKDHEAGSDDEIPWRSRDISHWNMADMAVLMCVDGFSEVFWWVLMCFDMFFLGADG